MFAEDLCGQQHNPGLSSLNFLTLKQCKLRQMSAVGTVKDTLQLLNFNGNRITQISRQYFEGFTYLKQVFLADNRLIRIPDVSPVRHALQMMALSFNYITSIPSLLLDHIYPCLTSVCLYNNGALELTMVSIRKQC